MTVLVYLKIIKYYNFVLLLYIVNHKPSNTKIIFQNEKTKYHNNETHIIYEISSNNCDGTWYNYYIEMTTR